MDEQHRLEQWQALAGMQAARGESKMQWQGKTEKGTEAPILSTTLHTAKHHKSHKHQEIAEARETKSNSFESAKAPETRPNPLHAHNGKARTARAWEASVTKADLLTRSPWGQ